MAAVVLDKFSGGNPEGWVSQAERYFTFLGFSEEYWLPLPYFYLEGDALIWFDWLHRNQQFYDWKHFKEKLLMRFRQRSFASSVESVACFDSSSVGPISIPEVLPAAMESTFDNAKPEEVAELKIASDLDDGNLSPINNSEVTPEMLESLVGSISDPTDFTSLIVSMGGNCNVDTPLEINIGEEEYSWNYACKVLADITEREIDMDIEDSVKIATQVFEKMGHNCCTKVLSDEYDLDDGNLEEDNVLADNSQNNKCELPSHIIDMTSFLISFAKCEFKVKHRTALINVRNQFPVGRHLSVFQSSTFIGTTLC
ncbi:hypothetical protein A4A49_13295 [Nicotiana attenuata]|uniref:Uncharacterized protein n=1 Tax=Nicotiana attenuata TaxID=49451 RepID=A0A1J6IWD0_NICAT|nr:hypothetical protein A4A49_13295 [Nicotiana attenuata]